MAVTQTKKPSTKKGKRYPENWEKFTSEDWCTILSKQPRFVDKCDVSKIEDKEWVRLVLAQPELIKARGTKNISGKVIGELFQKIPQIIDECELSELGRMSWAKLLAIRPDYASKCDFSIFQAGYASYLCEAIAVHPDLAEKIDFDRLGRDGDVIKMFCRQPQLLSKYDVSKLDESDWAEIVAENPEVATKFRLKLEDFSSRNKIRIVTINPDLANAVGLDKVEGDFSEAVLRHPSLSEKFDLQKMDAYGIERLLLAEPKYIDKVDLSKLDHERIFNLVNKRPELLSRFNFTALESYLDSNMINSGRGRAQLILADPKLVDRFELSLWTIPTSYWALILARHPELKDKYLFKPANSVDSPRDWTSFNVQCWSILLQEQPQFADCCDFTIFKKNSVSVAGVLIKQPQLEGKCNWDTFAPDAWAMLLSERPEFVEKFETSKCKGKRTEY